MNPQLAEAFAAGSLVRPLWDQPDLVHLVRAMATLGGVSGLDGSLPVKQLLNLIGPTDHVLFVLLDGLGMNLVHRLPGDCFIVRHLKAQIRAACPSTTAAALTSIATADWPAQHGVCGWFTHLPEHGLTATLLPFTERYSQQPLTSRGLHASDILTLPAFYTRMKHQSLSLLPEPITNTEYATWSRGYTAGLGYKSIADAVDKMIAHVGHAPGPTHTHLYVPDIDSLCHKRGVSDPAVDALVLSIDREMARLAEAIGGRGRIVITADHGLIDVPPANHLPIFEGDPLLDLLDAPPSGDARLPMFHVKEGRRKDFVAMFSKRFSHSMVPVPIEEAEQLQLFGPEPLSEVARRHFGSFAGIAHRPATLLYHAPMAAPKTPPQPYYAQHAGLSVEEMVIPLVIA